MGLIITNFDPPFRPGRMFDFLGRKAAGVLSDLFPGVQVILDYTRGRVGSNDQPSPALAKGSAPGLLKTRFASVPDDRRWKRRISVMPSEAVRHFLGFDSGESYDDNESQRHSRGKRNVGHHMTSRWEHFHEVVTAVAACEHTLNIWAKYVGPDLHPEVKMALSDELPRWVVSRMIATLHCVSGVSASGNRSHDALAKTIAEIQRYFESLASYRVEGKELSHGVLIASPPKTAKPLKTGTYPDDFQTLKRTALLADGLRAALWISPAGEVVGWLTAASLAKSRRRARTAAEPFGFLGLPSEASLSLRGIFLALRKNGSIVIFVNGQPLFMWRAGKWRGLLWDSVKKRIKEKYGAIGATMLDAAVILSTTGQSGVLGLVNNFPGGLHEKDRVDIARRGIGRSDMHRSRAKVYIGPSPAPEEGFRARYPEWSFHALLQSDKVISLGPSTLAMLASIDGATLINSKGKLLAYGAIISSRPSGSEGARSAAALELSSNGFVIKVSADGPIAVYEGGREIVEV